MADKFIVTGAAGFIGSTLSERLLKEGHRVVGVDCITDYYNPTIKRDHLAHLTQHSGFEFLETNILKMDLARALDGAKAVFHLAAQAGVRASWGKTFESYIEHNIHATQVLLEAVKERPIPVVYASSSSVYGDAESLPTRESDLPKPVSPYGVTKLAAEHLCNLYCKNFQVPSRSLRFFTVYGPRQRPDMAFHKFIKSALKGQAITLFDDGEQTRDFTFVDDIVSALIAASEKGRAGGIYNLGGGSRISVNGVIEMLGRVLNRPIKVERLGAQKGDVRHTCADTSAAQSDLGYQPSVSLEEGLRREAEWIESRMELLA